MARQGRRRREVCGGFGQQSWRQSWRHSLLADYAVTDERPQSGKYGAASFMVARHGGIPGAGSAVWRDLRWAEPTGADGGTVWRLHGDGRNHDADWRSLGPGHLGNERLF